METSKTFATISNHSAQKLSTIRSLKNLEAASLGHVLNLIIDAAYQQTLVEIKTKNTIPNSI